MKHQRILLKISGESLSGSQVYGINKEALHFYASEIKSAYDSGLQIGVVIGGGNIFRGIQGAEKGYDRVQGDYMGMLATVINSMALQAELQAMGAKTIVLSGLAIDPLCEKMSSQRAIEYLNKNYIVIMSAGTGNPFFTTDSTGALRALEIKASLFLKGTRVSGVYDKDPEKYEDALKFKSLTFNEAYDKKLNIMDLTAFTLCKENNLSIIVFNMNEKGNLVKAIKGENIGTLISN